MGQQTRCRLSGHGSRRSTGAGWLQLLLDVPTWDVNAVSLGVGGVYGESTCSQVCTWRPAAIWWWAGGWRDGPRWGKPLRVGSGV